LPKLSRISGELGGLAQTRELAPSRRVRMKWFLNPKIVSFLIVWCAKVKKAQCKVGRCSKLVAHRSFAC